MRVGLVCPYSLGVPGGVQSHVLDLADALLDLGHEVAVLAPGPSAPRAFVSTTGPTLPVPFNGSVARVAFGPRAARQVRRWLAGHSFDVLHVHEPAAPSLSLLALRQARMPVVATYHTSQERGWALDAAAATVLRSALGRIGAHVAVSSEAARTAAGYLGHAPQVVPNGVRVDRFRSSSVRRGGGVLFLGRGDEPRKGLDVLLAAWPAILAQEPTARLTLAGVASASGPSTTALGVVSEADKVRLLQDADVVVTPNTHGESFGIVLVEAMAAGAAVVASDLPAFRAVLDDGRCGGLFRTGDKGDLAATVARLLADPAARTALAARGQRSAGRYDWSAVAPALVEVYSVASGRGAGELLPRAGEALPRGGATPPGQPRRTGVVQLGGSRP